MLKTVLSLRQKLLLRLFSSDPHIQKNFYLSGGTALAEYYLHHRYSEDLDFFTEKEVDPLSIQIFLNQSLKKPVLKR